MTVMMDMLSTTIGRDVKPKRENFQGKQTRRQIKDALCV